MCYINKLALPCLALPQSVKNSTVLELMKKKPYRPSILNGLKEQLEGQFQMSEGHVLEFKELKAQTNIEVPTHVKPSK